MKIDPSKELEFTRLKFSSILTQAMVSAQMTVRVLSEKSGIKKQVLEDTLRGNHRALTLDIITKLILVCGFRVDMSLEFIEGGEEEKDEPDEK